MEASRLVFQTQLILILILIDTNLSQCKLLSPQDIINNCQDCPEGPICLSLTTFNLTNYACSASSAQKPKTCQVPFTSIVKTKSSKFKVRLVGPGIGWVGLAFSQDAGAIERSTSFGIICIYLNGGVKNDVRLVSIQNAPARPGLNLFDPAPLAGNGVTNPKTSIQDEFLLCEFELSPNLKVHTRPDDISKTPYKIGLAYNDKIGIDDDNGKLSAHRKAGSTQGKVDALMRLEVNVKADEATIKSDDPKVAGSGPSGVRSQLALAITMFGHIFVFFCM